MEKLTLEQIAPYLPYGLKLQIQTNPLKNEIHTVNGVLCDGLLSMGGGGRFGFIQRTFDAIQPILRPMDLTKPIVVEGKEVIPIVELAKIAYPQYEWNKNQINYITQTLEGSIVDFWHFASDFMATTVHAPSAVGNQLELFQWLFKHKFDVVGLIEKGLAIDVNTLNKNPYE